MCIKIPCDIDARVTKQALIVSSQTGDVPAKSKIEVAKLGQQLRLWCLIVMGALFMSLWNII